MDGEVTVDPLSEQRLVDVVGGALNFLSIWRQFFYILLAQCPLTGVARGCGLVARLCDLSSRGGDLTYTFTPRTTHHLAPGECGDTCPAS